MLSVIDHLHPIWKRVLWVLYAIAFYQSGLQFTTLLMNYEIFEGGINWLWAAAFPFLLVGFFLINKRLGCATGQCQQGRCDIPSKKDKDDDLTNSYMP